MVNINLIKRGDSLGGEESKIDLRGYHRRGRGPEGVLDVGRWSVAELAKPRVNGRRGWGYSARR